MAAKIRGVLGGADDKTIDALGRFGGSIGVAFQLQDDLLNITESSVARAREELEVIHNRGQDYAHGSICALESQ